jgi:hypothetical protein
LSDSHKYQQQAEDGKYIAWWEYYLKDEGFEIEYRPLKELRSIKKGTVGLLVFRKPLEAIGHIVAIDEVGVIDPLTNPAKHENLDSFWEIFQLEEWQLYHKQFLASWKSV